MATFQRPSHAPPRPPPGGGPPGFSRFAIFGLGVIFVTATDYVNDHFVNNPDSAYRNEIQMGIDKIKKKYPGCEVTPHTTAARPGKLLSFTPEWERFNFMVDCNRAGNGCVSGLKRIQKNEIVDC